MVSTKEAIGIFELVVFIPLTHIALYVSWRHGWWRQMGWVFLFLFCGIRAATGGLFIASGMHPNDKGEAVWAAILGSIGLNPLLLSSMELLMRVYDLSSSPHKHNKNTPTNGIFCRTQNTDPKSIRIWLLRGLHIPCILALVLVIIGGVNLADSDPSKEARGKTFSKAGVIIFVCAFIILVVIAVIMIPSTRNAPSFEKRILYAVLAAFPFLAVRLVYTIIASFSSLPRFSIRTADPILQLVMVTLEELVVVLLYLLVGWMAPRETKQTAADEVAMRYRGGLQNEGVAC
jgi:hypothetical protein